MSILSNDLRPCPSLRGWIAAVVLTLSACASPNAPSPSRLEMSPDGSFAITQDVRVGVGVSGDFDAARRFVQHRLVRSAMAELQLEYLTA